ncbi:MAG: aminodeoxychorismate lyase [Patescibacteria group bacterium]|nr:MAG: aminodeoxychorismate lyase [Patescibacteria group bacterium]
MTEPPDPEKFHVLTPAAKKRLIFAGLFFVLIVLPFLLRSYYRVAINRPSQSGKEVNIEIKRGSSVADIAKQLQAAGAINSDFLFNIYVYTGKLGSKIQAGTYTLPAGSNLKQVVEIIQYGTNDVKMTFIEGWRVEEYARYATSRLNNVDFRDFIELAKEREGYLFPDTYFVNKDIQEEELVEILSDNFAAKTQDLLTEINLQKAGLTKDQAIIFASMVEREIHTEEDRPIVAGILLKRWRQGMKLDVDATTQYVASLVDVCRKPDHCLPNYDETKDFDWWPKILSQDDLELDSPYNTRKNPGLPPAPISNPGLSAIKAVLFAQESPYYFYLTDKEGITHYASTLEQHNANVSRYLQ